MDSQGPNLLEQAAKEALENPREEFTENAEETFDDVYQSFTYYFS